MVMEKTAPTFGRFDVRTGVAVWGYASGGIRVDTNAAGGGFTASTEPVAAMDVSFEHRLVVHADTRGFLHVHTYSG